MHTKLCQIPWKGLKKISLTSTVGLSSKADCILCIMDSSWASHESPGRKPDWEGVKSLLCRK